MLVGMLSKSTSVTSGNHKLLKRLFLLRSEKNRWTCSPDVSMFKRVLWVRKFVQSVLQSAHEHPAYLRLE